MNKGIIFVVGGAKSGKSTFTIKKSSKIPGKKAYIATAEALDEEMRQRIENHKRQRGDEWITYEEPLKIANLIEEKKDSYAVLLIDCLTLWLSNVIHADLSIETETEHLISSLITPHSSLMYIVSNEVGMGIVPDNKLSRRFRDMAGILNQKVAQAADEVYFMVSGIPLKVKG
jgi:adenosylcobinamide kinase/adenosylcobinamide-phosphate guanylyltransferase